MTPIHRLASATLYTAVAVAFTWPLAPGLREGGRVVSRHFDEWGTLWYAYAVGAGAGSHTLLSNWPLGLSLLGADSLVLALLAATVGRLVDPALLVGGVVLLGPVCGALAAEHAAERAFGARWPWSILAGLGYGWCGLASTAVLEGHSYFLFNPWLPLLVAEVVVLAERPHRGSPARVLAWWTGCLLTSAYVGLAASLTAGLTLLACGGVRALGRRDVRWTGAALTAVGLAYLGVFVAGGSSPRIASAWAGDLSDAVALGSTFPVFGLLGWTPASDVGWHSGTPSVGATALVLAALAPILAPGQRTRRFLLVILVLLVVAAGKTLIPYPPARDGLPGLLSAFPDVVNQFVRFPVRLGWGVPFLIGAMGAYVATRIAAGPARRWAWPLLGTAVLDPFIGTGTPLRTGARPLDAPSAYAAAPPDLPVLDVLPSFRGSEIDLALLLSNRLCAYQLHHGRPLLQNCVSTAREVGGEALVRSWLDGAVYGERGAEELARGLGRLGIGAVALHPDLHPRHEAARWTQVLEGALGPAVAASSDAGERVTLWRVPAPERDPETIRTAWSELLGGRG